MGQKVNPVGFRLGVKSNRKNIYKNTISQDKSDIFDRKHFFNFPPKINNLYYGKNLHQNFIIKSYLTEIFTKSGYFISHFFIDESKEAITIKLDLFSRSATSKAMNFGHLDNLVTGGSLTPCFFSSKKDFQEIKESSRNNEGSDSLRKRSWTNRRLKWRTLNSRDFQFFSKFLEKTVTGGVPIKWKIRLLNKNLNYNSNLIKKLFRNLGRSKRQPFFNDGLNVFSLVLNEPHAPLLAEYIA